MRIIILVLAFLCAALPAHATTSQIDPTVPVSGEDVDADPIRENFQIAHDEISALQNRNVDLPPLVANSFYGSLAGGTPFGIVVPPCNGLTNALTWTAGVGFGCNAISTTATLAPQAAYTVLAGPLGGSPAVPTPRALTANDLPLPSANSIGGVESLSPIANQFMTGVSTNGVPTTAQPSFGNLFGNISVSQMNGGVGASSTTCFFGDGTWKTPSGGGGGFTALTGDVTASGSGSVAATLTNSPTARADIGLGTSSSPSFAGLTLTTTALGASNGGTGVTSAQLNGTFVGINPIAGATAEYPFIDGSGTTVSDISGNGNTATFSSSPAPTWTTYGITINSVGASANQYVQTPVKTWKTVIINVCSPPLNAGVIGLSNLTVGGTFPDGLYLYMDTSLSVPSIATYYPGLYNNGHGLVTSTTTLANLCSNIAWTLDTSDHIYIDGNESAYAVHGASAANVTTTTTGYALGSSGAGSTNGVTFIGEINYTVFYSTALSQTQIQQEDAYINAKVYARPGYPGNTASSSSVSPSVICVGDSLTAASNGGGVPWCNSTFTVTNNAYTFLAAYQPGNGTDTEFGPSSGHYVTLIPKAGGKSYCHFWLGTNDNGAGWTAAQIWGRLQFFAKQAAAKGCLPIIATMIDRQSEDAAKNSLDTLIRANWRAAGFVGLDDLAAIPGLGADGAWNNPVVTCFDGGGIHLTGSGTGCYNSMAGYGVVGWTLGRLINILDGATIDNPTVTTSTAYAQNIGDNYVLQTPASSATDTLPDCTGLTGISRTITNGSGSNAITVQTSASQTITGSATVAANAIGKFTCELIGSSTGGNYWLRTQ